MTGYYCTANENHLVKETQKINRALLKSVKI